MLFIGFLVAWGPHIAPDKADYLKPCLTNWWHNALYINNFDIDLCYGVTWYLAADMQFYCIAPFFLLAIHYAKKVGFCAIIAGILYSICSTIFLIAFYDLPAISMIIDQSRNDEYFYAVHIKPWT
ncbi:hypothetical protein PMAYCL1PPCAC_15356, partial [Pristionchus mayeri]